MRILILVMTLMVARASFAQMPPDCDAILENQVIPTSAKVNQLKGQLNDLIKAGDSSLKSGPACELLGQLVGAYKNLGGAEQSYKSSCMGGDNVMAPTIAAAIENDAKGAAWAAKMVDACNKK